MASLPTLRISTAATTHRAFIDCPSSSASPCATFFLSRQVTRTIRQSPFTSQCVRASFFRSQASLEPVGKSAHFASIPSQPSGPQIDMSQLLLTSCSTFFLQTLLTLPVCAADFEPSYSPASYWTSLGLFVISLPGLQSLIKRATKSKVVRKTFEVAGPASEGAKPLPVLAGEMTSFLQRNSYKVLELKDVVTFEGNIEPSRSQAAFLVFCTGLSLASVALVLTITAPQIGEWWYGITLLSPLVGVYYWTKAKRTEQLQVKMITADDERTVDIVMQGDDEIIDRLRRELQLMEKGLIYVKGIFEM